MKEFKPRERAMPGINASINIIKVKYIMEVEGRGEGGVVME